MTQLKSKIILDKMPRYNNFVKKILTLITFFVLGLFLLPWRQNAIGQGFVIAYSPNERKQAISAPMAGRLGSWYVNEGSHVDRGDPIVSIIDNDPNLLERLRLKQKAQELNLEAAKQAVKTALVNVARQQKLYEIGASSKRKLEKAKLEHMSYLQKSANAEIELTKIQVSIARQKNQMIRAPVSGTILRRKAGQQSVMVHAGDILATLVPETRSRAAEIFIDGNDIALIKIGDMVRLQFEGWPALQLSGWPAVAVGSFPGRVISIDSASPSQGHFRILVAPEQLEDWPEAHFLRQGVRVNAWVLLNQVTLGYELWRQFNGFPPLREKIRKRTAHNAKKGIS